VGHARVQALRQDPTVDISVIENCARCDWLAPCTRRSIDCRGIVSLHESRWQNLVMISF